MKINFVTLHLVNFKSHQDITVNFGERTDITGDNAQGKSSILEAPTWVLFGTDTFGSKLDPSPITYEADLTKVSLLLEVDEKKLLLSRELKNGKMKYIINDVPSKATEFNECVAQIFDKDLFLSLYNPSYFFMLHWEKQRAMILQYVSTPINKEVFQQLPPVQGDKLAELTKKHSLDDLEKIHRDNKRKKEKEYIAAQSRTKTLMETADNNSPSVAIDSVKVELNQLIKQREEIEKVTDSAADVNGRINALQRNINDLLQQRDRMKEEYKELKGEEIDSTCPTCKQPLIGEALKAVVVDKENRIARFKEKYNQVVAARKELEAELQNLEYIDVSEQLAKVRELQSMISPLEQELNKFKEYERLLKEIKEAKKTEKETLESLNESIFILDSIKAFRAKEAEMQSEKVQGLFDSLSVKLFEELKNGEIKPTFEIMMDGKEYKRLSLSEGIRAGLELREVLSEQSGIIAPVFVDNAESITSFKEPTGQLIVSRVVAGQELKIEKTGEN